MGLLRRRLFWRQWKFKKWSFHKTCALKDSTTLISLKWGINEVLLSEWIVRSWLIDLGLIATYFVSHASNVIRLNVMRRRLPQTDNHYWFVSCDLKQMGKEHHRPGSKIFIIVDVRAKSNYWAPIGKLLLSTEDILHWKTDISISHSSKTISQKFRCLWMLRWSSPKISFERHWIIVRKDWYFFQLLHCVRPEGGYRNHF